MCLASASSEVAQLGLQESGQVVVPFAADRDAAARTLRQHQHVEVHPVEPEPGPGGDRFLLHR